VGQQLGFEVGAGTQPQGDRAHAERVPPPALCAPWSGGVASTPTCSISSRPEPDVVAARLVAPTGDP
jgi:hypothetical protein